MKYVATILLTLCVLATATMGQNIEVPVVKKPAATTPKPVTKPTPKPAPKPTLDVTPQTLSFAEKGGSTSVTVNASSGKWNKPYSQEKWVTLATKGNTVTVTVSANTNTQKRSTSFKVVSGNLSKTVSITQDGAKKQNPGVTKPSTGIKTTNTPAIPTKQRQRIDAAQEQVDVAPAIPTENKPKRHNHTNLEKRTSLSLSSYSESFKAEGESKTITVNASEWWVSGGKAKGTGKSADWYIGTQPDASWVSYAINGDRLTIKVSPNQKTTKRTDYFTVKCGDKEKRFDITQAAATPKPVDRSYGQWVDLGLPSGTLWKNTNETNPSDSHGFYTFVEAESRFGNKLPTKEQLDELKDKCKWTWKSSKKGYIVVGPNGNSIFLPAAGYRDCNDGVNYVGSDGYYWSSTPGGSDYAWYLNFYSGAVYVYGSDRCDGRSVRLVQD